MRQALKSSLLVFLVLAAAPKVASAELIFTFQEVGGNVELTVSGSIDLDATLGFTQTSINDFQFIRPVDGVILAGPAANSDVYPTSAAAWEPFGGGGFGPDFSSASGDRIALFIGGEFGLPVGYVSDAQLSAAGTFVGETFASLGMVPGLYVTTFSNGGVSDSVTVNVGQDLSPVPEPATLALVALGFAGAAARMRRRKQR